MRASLVFLVVLSFASSGEAFADAKSEAVARFSRVKSWTGSVRCETTASYNGMGPGSIMLGDPPKPVPMMVKHKLHRQASVQMTLERSKESGTVSWYAEKRGATGSFHEDSLVTVGKPMFHTVESGNVTTYAKTEEFRANGDEPPANLAINADTGTYFLDCNIGVDIKGKQVMTQFAGPQNVKVEQEVHHSPEMCDVERALPTTGTSISGTWERKFKDTLQTAVMADHVTKCTFDFQPTGMDVVDEPTVTGPQCACNDDVIRISAAPPKQAADAKLVKFEITTKGGAKPKIVAQEVGKPAGWISVSGDGSKVGATTVAAVYKKGTATYTSAPYAIHFCKLEEPKVSTAAAKSKWFVTNHDFVFDVDGKLEIELDGKAWLDGKDAADKLRWQSEAAWLPSSGDARGKKGIFKAATQPRSNKDFGPRKLATTFKEEGCACQKAREVRIFFARDGEENPSKGKSIAAANWAFYWRQTTAFNGVDFEYVDKLPSIPGEADNPDTKESRAIGGYKPTLDKILLTKHVTGACAARPDLTEDTGIDCFANTIRHETRHRDQYIQWWGPKLQRYCSAVKCPDDLDTDYVPDALEEKLGCSKYSQKSCPSLPKHLLNKDIQDNEFDAYEYGWKWKRGSADKEDWACPGKQCTKK